MAAKHRMAVKIMNKFYSIIIIVNKINFKLFLSQLLLQFVHDSLRIFNTSFLEVFCQDSDKPRCPKIKMTSSISIITILFNYYIIIIEKLL